VIKWWEGNSREREGQEKIKRHDIQCSVRFSDVVEFDGR
jgi:hypothetical protein